MKKIIIISAIFIFAAAIGIGISTHYTTIKSDIALRDVEALADMGESWFSDWWDSTVYKCEQRDCVVEYGIPPFFSISKYGKYEACLPGGDVAHCWNCAQSCDVLF